MSGLLLGIIIIIILNLIFFYSMCVVLCAVLCSACVLSPSHTLHNWRITFHVQRSSSHVYTHTFLSWPCSRWQHNTDARHSFTMQPGKEVTLLLYNTRCLFLKIEPHYQCCKTRADVQKYGTWQTFRFPLCPNIASTSLYFAPLCAFFAQLACSQGIMGTCPTTLQPLFVSKRILIKFGTGVLTVFEWI